MAKSDSAQKLIGDFSPKLVELTDRVLFDDVWERKELRNEAQLNCVSLRSEFDCEVTWGAVKGQDKRPLRGRL